MRWLARKVPVKDSLATVFCNRFLSFDENRNGVGLNLLGVTDELLADTLKSDDFKKLLAKVSDEWPTEQKKWDYILDGKRSNWTNNVSLLLIYWVFIILFIILQVILFFIFIILFIILLTIYYLTSMAFSFWKRYLPPACYRKRRQFSATIHDEADFTHL